MEKVVKSILTTLMLAFSAQSIVATPSDELVGKTDSSIDTASLEYGSKSNDISKVPIGIQDTMDKCMTKEQYEAYSDSIYRSRHPRLPYAINENFAINPNSANRNAQQRSSSDFFSNSHVPNSISIDTNLEVGQIDIESGMSSTGARTYTIPIKVFDGHGIFAPSISLVYNSQGAYGVAGRGWSIGGLSTITRGFPTLYYDGRARGQTNTTEDVFFLDGVRLICTNMTTHTYESETGHIIVKGITSGNDYASFVAFYPNGWKGTFNVQNGTVYYISELANERGQKITIQYMYDSFQYFPSKIDYGTDNNYGTSISFVYDNSRADYVRGYQAGLSHDSHKILKSIECRYHIQTR